MGGAGHVPQAFPNVRFNIPKLTKQSYVEWKRKVDAALYFMQATDYIQREVKYEEVKDNLNLALKFMSAYTLIDNEISMEIRQNLGVLVPYSPYHLYRCIVELFEPRNAASRLRNRRRFFRLTCAEPKDVGKFCTIIEQMCSNLATMSVFTDEVIAKMVNKDNPDSVSAKEIDQKRVFIEKVVKVIEDIDKMAVLLGGIPDAFETITTIIENDPSASYNTSKDMIVAQAQKITQSIGPSSERLNVVSTSISSASPSPTVSMSNSNHCTHCNRDGHTIVKCWNLHPELAPKSRGGRGGRGSHGRGRGQNQAQSSGPSNIEDAGGFDFATLFIGEEDEQPTDQAQSLKSVKMSNNLQVCTAYLDSGASWTMTGPHTNDLLKDRQPLDRSVVIHYPNGAYSVADESATLSFPSKQAVGNGEVSFRNVIISDTIKNTVFSVAKICDTGAVVAFCKTHAVVLRKNSEGTPVPVWTVPRVGNLYKADLDIPCKEVNLTNCPDDYPEVNFLGIEDLLKVEPPASDLIKLHYRLGHVNEYAIKKAVAAGTLLGIPKDVSRDSIGKCIVCDVAKMRKKSRPKESNNRATEVLEHFVADTSGLQSVATPGGIRGYSVIVDEMSGYVNVLLIKQKSEVQKHVKTFRAYAENKHGKKLKCFRSDNAKEYVLKQDFVKSLVKDGVRMEQCCEYEHAQNGLAEREVGVLAKLCQTNLEQAGAPKWLWGEAMRYSALQRILQPRKRLNYKTPFEIWNNKTPNIEMLKPWGCLAIAFRPPETRRKIEPTGVRCLYLGIDANKKGYRLMSLKDKSVIITPNATFYESVFPYKLKTVADYIVSQVVPNGLSEAIKDDLKKEEPNETPFELPVIVEKKDAPFSCTTPPKSFVWADVPVTPVTPVPVPLATNKLTVTPVLDVTHLMPKEVIAVPSGPKFVTAGKKTTHYDSGVAKWMENFDPTKKRDSKREVNSNVIATSNYFDILSEDFEKNEDVSGYDEEYCFMMKEGPFTYSQAMSSPSKNSYVTAAQRELNAFVENEVYELIPPDAITKDEKVFHPRWVFGQKWDGSYKARLTVDGSRQQRGLHYIQSRADTLSLPLLRFMLTLIMLYKMIPYQFDVPNAFLQSHMDTPVYLCQPQGFVDQQHPQWIWKLKKCVYGLKQASLHWRSTFHDFVTKELNFHEVGYNTCAYLLSNQSGITSILLVYVDDFILACNDEILLQNIVKSLIKKCWKVGLSSSFHHQYLA